MRFMDGAPRWGGRVRKADLRRLYAGYVEGLVDAELLDEVGTTLYIRCRDILYIHDAENGDWRCPPCEAEKGPGKGPRMEMPGRRRKGAGDLPHRCPECGHAMSWSAFRRTFKRRQLNPGGAVPAFSGFVSSWEAARTADGKMLAVDRVIHSFHYSMKSRPDWPTRAAGVNLIEGRLYDVVTFLDALSAGRSDPAGETWRTELNRQKELWGGWWETQRRQRERADGADGEGNSR